MSPRANTALPATSNSAPARTTSPTVVRSTPPSTSMRNESSAALANLNQRFNLAQRAGNEFLGAKTGIHRHDQHVVHDVQNLVEHLHGRRRIDHHRRLASMRRNQVQRAIEVHAGFLCTEIQLAPASAKAPI